MTSFPIRTKLNFPTTTSPSLTCLQWSGDGQVFLVTKSAVYIVTPKQTAVIKPPNSKRLSHDNFKLLDWFRTMIEIDRKKFLNWNAVSEDWGAIALGSLDVSIQDVAISPSSLTQDSGCVAAVLSSNMELSLWAPDRNRLQGKWGQIQNITSVLREYRSEHDHPAAHALQAQATSVAWSRQADFGVDPAPPLDASLLSVGTRAGKLMFLRFEDGKVACHDQIKVSNNWLTHVTFSPWTLVKKGTCETHLACGTSNGSVELVTVTQTLISVPSSSGLGPNFSFQPKFQHHGRQVGDHDKGSLTALTWIESRHNMILVASKPGLVSLLTPPSSTLGWSGRRRLRFQAQKLSVGSSSLQPVSGVHHLPAHDALIICLADGSFHIVHHVSLEPSWTSIVSGNDLASHILSENLRLSFAQAEPGKVKYTDVNRVSGLIPYDGQATLLWMHESCRPTDLNYTYDTKHRSMFVAAQLWKHPSHDPFLHDFESILSTAKTTTGTPIHLLRPFNLYILEHPDVFQDVVRLLRSHNPTSEYLCNDIDILPSHCISPGPTLRQEFRACLSRYLFGSNLLLRLRMKLSVADMVLRTLPECSTRVECEGIACHLFRTLSQIILRTLVNHIASIVDVLTFIVDDFPFSLRLTAQSSLPGCPSALVAEATTLAHTIYSNMSTVGSESIVKELCPACGIEILLESGANAICANGHSWGRCSITSFILSTGMVRRCVGCSRKALLPLSCNVSPDIGNWLPKAGQSWIVEELLEAVSRCLFCGNSFVWAL